MNNINLPVNALFRRGFPFFLLFFLVCANQQETKATSRVYIPPGFQVRQAGLVATADVVSGESPDKTVVLREIIKGDLAQTGKTLVLTRQSLRVIDYLPKDAKSFVVLLKPDWTTNSYPLLGIYFKPEEIEAVRAFVPIYELATEKQRLLALREKALQDKSSAITPILRQQLWADLGQMRERENFQILLDLFPRGDEAQQRSVIELLSRIGDVRAIPTLLQALESPHRSVALAASHPLTYQFAGAPGVTAAFRKLLVSATLDDDWKRNTAYWYLKRYDASAARPLDPRREAQYKAYDAMRADDKDKALAEFFAASRDAEQAKSLVLHSFEIIRYLREKHPEKENAIRNALMPTLTKQIETGSGYDAQHAALVLRALRHADAVGLLLRSLVQNTKDEYDDATRIAAWSLFDGGEKSRAAALQVLKARPDWNALRPVFEAAQSPDAGAALVAMLRAFNEMKGFSMDDQKARRWTIHRLGEMGEARAAPSLIASLQPDGDNAAAVAALHKIDSPEVETGIEPLLRSKNDGFRTIALDLLFARKGALFLPELRKMMVEENYGSRSGALLYLARVGTIDDLKMLMPRADFWTGDRANHYWYWQAIIGLRERHNFDFNGPIHKK